MLSASESFFERPKSRYSRKWHKEFLRYDFSFFKQNGNNLTKLQHNKRSLSAMCTVLCKPVSVSLTKLTAKEIEVYIKKNSSKLQTKNASQQKSKPKKNRKVKRIVLRKGSLKKKVSNKDKAKSESIQKNKPVKTIQKNIHQPYIKLHRIDEVINKIAQSFAKVTSNKDNITCLQKECMREAQTESDVSGLFKLSSLNSVRNECLQNRRSKDSSSSHVDEILQKDECEKNTQLECVEQTQTELSTTIPKLLPLNTNEEDNCAVEDTSEFHINKVSEIKEHEASIQTEYIGQIQTDLNEPVSELNADKEKDVQNHVVESVELESHTSKVKSKASLTKKHKTGVQTECMIEIAAALNESAAELQPSTAEKEHPEDHGIENIASESYLDRSSEMNESIESNRSDSSDEEEIYRSKKKWRFKRTRRLIDDSQDDSEGGNNFQNLIPGAIKRQRLSLPETVTEVNVISENQLQTKSSQKLDTSDKLCHRSKSPSIIKNKSVERDHVDKNIDKDNSLDRVPSELNDKCTKEDNTLIDAGMDDFIKIEEPILHSKDIQGPMQEFCVSDEYFIQKYKLTKELRVLLIKFDFEKNATKQTTSKECSAAAVEKLTKACASPWQPKLHNYSKQKSAHRNENVTDKTPTNVVSSKHSSANPKKSSKSLRERLKIKFLMTPNKRNYTIVKRVQLSSESSLVSSKKHTSNSSATMWEGRGSEIQKACHNLTESFENSEGRSEKFIRDDSKNQRSRESVAASTQSSPSPSQRSVDRISELSTANESGIGKEKYTNEISDIDAGFPQIPDINTLKANLNAIGRKAHTFKTPKKISDVTYSKSAMKVNPPSYSSMLTPAKHKKPVDKKDVRTTCYKCIVCDFCFEDYSNLQQHLAVHTQKQSNTVASSAENLSTPSKRPQETGSSCSSEPETPKSQETSKQKAAKQSSSKSKSPRNSVSKKRRKKKLLVVIDSNDCTVCSKVFQRRADLAAHIFLHTEKELQQASKSANGMLDNNEHVDEEKLERSSEEATKRDSANKDSTVVDETTQKTGECRKAVSSKEKSLPVQKADKMSAQVPVKKATGSKEVASKVVESLPMKPVKEKTGKMESTKKPYTICECHNKPGTNENCLQIEIVLLCHTCKILFRSVECFEAHYRLLKHADCNKSRLNNGRSPNLFCATCGMIFGSVQDVRLHLETHARFQMNYKTDFRCNICKVIFLGIGTLFYIHWSNHAKDPFWIASERSFPKDCVVKLKSKRPEEVPQRSVTTANASPNTSTEYYFQVAEYVCIHCKFPFVTEEDLHRHIQRCGKLHAPKDSNSGGSSSASAEKRITIKMMCSLCDDNFTEKGDLYKHMWERHKLAISVPQCSSIKFPNKTVYMCTVCMEVVESLPEFDDHWLRHNMINVYACCTHCKKIFQNSFNKFMENCKKHVAESNNTLCCTVRYARSEFPCTLCSIGFNSLESLRSHVNIHGPRGKEVLRRIAEESSATTNNWASKSAESRESAAAKQTEKPFQKDTRVIEETLEACSLRCSANDEEEKQKNASQDSEDDSEHELVIDLTEQQDGLNALSTRAESKEEEMTQNASDLVPETSSTSEIFASSESIVTNTVPNSGLPNNVDSCNDDALAADEATGLVELNAESAENTRNAEVRDTVSSVNQEDAAEATGLPTSKKHSPQRPKTGFLRVKTLAELRGPLYQCEFYGSTMINTKELTGHHNSQNAVEMGHDASKKDGNVAEKVSPNPSLQPKSPALEPGNILKRSLQIGKLLQASSKPPSSASPSFSSSPVQKVVPVPKWQIAQPSTAVRTNPQPQRTEPNASQNRQPASLPNVTTAYHKNLPPINIVRTTPVPRSAILRSDGSGYKMLSAVNPQKLQKQRTISPPSFTRIEHKLSSFVSVMDSSDNNYKCKFCDFRSASVSECLKHELPGTQSSCKKQPCSPRRKTSSVPATSVAMEKPPAQKQYQPLKDSPSSLYYQYPYLPAGGTSSNSNQLIAHNRPVISSQPVTGTASPSIYYKNPNHNSGGMSIVINQTAPTVQNIPTIEILQQSSQQPIYQPQLYNEPLTLVDTSYLEQSQNVASFAGSNGGMYQVASNRYEMASGEEDVRTYELRLPRTAFVCPYCLKTYITKDLMQLHIDTDHNFICNICNLRLYTFTDLSIHKVKHSLI